MTLSDQLKHSDKNRENWHYTDLKKIMAKATTLPPSVKGIVAKIHHRPEVEQCLVFIDGEFRADRSCFGDLSKDIIVGDPLHGYSLTLAGETCLVTQPIELRFITTREGATDVVTKLSVTLGQSGRLSLLERHEKEIGCSPRQCHSLQTTITLDKQAKLVHGKISKDSGLLLATTNIRIDQGAYYDNFLLIEGGQLNRHEIEVEMIGPLAQCTLKGVAMLADDNHADVLTRIHHRAPHGTSRQYYKTIVDDQAQGIFQGKIVVAKDAQKTDGQQLSRALLLSDKAEVDTRPILEINADDVKCSHGSTVGDIDKDALFYLQSRGISGREARKLMVSAFADDAIDQIQINEWRETCRKEVMEWLHERG